jgi:putative transposase
MSRALDPFRFVLIAVAGWMNQHQLHIIDYLREENRVLREQVGGLRLRLNDDQRRRLAVKAKELGRKILGEVATIVTAPEPPHMNCRRSAAPSSEESDTASDAAGST